MSKHKDLHHHWIAIQDDLTGENGVDVVTWNYCLVCGKKLNIHNAKETKQGYHTKCSSAARLDAGVVNGCVIEFFIDHNSVTVQPALLPKNY